MLCSSGVLVVSPEVVVDLYSQGRQLQHDFIFLSLTLWFCLHEENVNVGRSWNVVVKRNLGRCQDRCYVASRYDPVL